MSILVDRNTRVIISGITGKQGLKLAQEMTDYGTQVVAGVTPGKGGTDVKGIPVYNTVAEAVRAHPDANTGLVSVPRDYAKDAAVEAIKSGKLPLINVLTEGIPNRDAAEMVEYAREYGVKVIGPASVGIIAPQHRVKIGAIGGDDPGVFYPGRIAVFSKSGGMCMSIALEIFNDLGYGVSTVVGVGGDRIVGTTFKDLLELVRDDSETQLVILNGEVGGTYEEEAARYISQNGFPKRVVARMSGLGGEAIFARGSRMGHAGAIIGEGELGSFESKVRALEDAGVPVARSSEELITLVEREMPRRGPDFERAIDSDLELVSISKAKLEGLKSQVRAVQTKTGLTQLVNGMPFFRGYALPDLMRKASIPEMVYMALREEDPSPDSMRDFAKALDCAREHAVVPNEALDAASASYAAGNSLNAACAAGLLAIDDSPVRLPAELADVVSEAEFDALVVAYQVIGVIAHALGNDSSPPYERRSDIVSPPYEGGADTASPPYQGGAGGGWADGARSLDEAFFAALAGRMPSKDEADLARAIFVACIDHTPATPSSLAAIASYSGGNSLKTALAAGITAMGDVHAGAGEGTAQFLTQALGDKERSGDIGALAQYVIDKFAGEFGGEKSKIPGYGHRYYSMYGDDPRAVALLEIAEERGVRGRFVDLALRIEALLKHEKAPGLCLNVDGAIGALISEMGIPPKAGKGTFIIPRTIGILAELREQTAGSFLRLANESIIYTGPEPGRVYEPTG